jgi:hypothetical protein
MSHELSQQHPQVVLRSRYQQLKALLVLAAITVVSLTAAVVILAVEDDGAKTVVAAPAVAAPVDTSTFTGKPGLRFDGGPEEGSRGPQAVSPAVGTRSDGGPDEGTRGPQSQPTPGGAADLGRWGPH